MKKWVKERKETQLSAWSITNINNFKGKVNIKFVFTFYFISFWPVQLALKDIEIVRFLVYFLRISCVENRSKKVNIPIFAVLNMCEPALDNENKSLA